MDRNKQEMKIHLKLLTDISDEVPQNGREHESMKMLMKSYVASGLLEGKTLLQQFEAMARKGHLKPGSYDKLKSVCEESGNANLLDLIQTAESEIRRLRSTSTTPGSSQQSNRDNGGTSVTICKRPSEDNVESDAPKQLKLDDTKFYPRVGKKGLMLILNSREKRAGTDLDVETIKRFFEGDLHYIVYDPRSLESTDLTTDQLDSCLDDIKQTMNSELGRMYHCFICVILSHGNENGIKTKDGYKNVEDIRREFNNDHVPNFSGRPKIFMIQACRGYETQASVATDLSDDDVQPTKQFNDTNDESDVVVQVPTDADTLLAFSTTPGYRSFRRLHVGSWFITECLRVFKQDHKKDHLEEMLITVRNNIAHSPEWQKSDGGKQMPCVWSTLTRRLML